MRQSGWSAESREEDLISILIIVFVQNPEADGMCRMILGDYKPELSEHISESFFDGCSLAGFQGLVRAKLQYLPRCIEKQERALQIMTRAWEEWALVEMELCDCARDAWTFRSGESSDKKGDGSKGRKRTRTDRRLPSPASGVGKKAIPSDSAKMVKRGVATSLKRARVHRALDFMVEAQRQAERGSEQGVDNLQQLERREREQFKEEQFSLLVERGAGPPLEQPSRLSKEVIQFR